MRPKRERLRMRNGVEMTNLPDAYARILNSEELRNRLGLGEKGSANNLVSVLYDENKNRVVFDLDLGNMDVFQLQVLRDYIKSKIPLSVLNFNTSFEADGKWYLEKK